MALSSAPFPFDVVVVVGACPETVLLVTMRPATASPGVCNTPLQPWGPLRWQRTGTAVPGRRLEGDRRLPWLHRRRTAPAVPTAVGSSFAMRPQSQALLSM